MFEQLVGFVKALPHWKLSDPGRNIILKLCWCCIFFSTL